MRRLFPAAAAGALVITGLVAWAVAGIEAAIKKAWGTGT